jgi:hypothetical protein
MGKFAVYIEASRSTVYEAFGVEGSIRIRGLESDREVK